MRRRIVYVNLLILMVLALLAAQHISAWQGFEREHNLSSMIRASGGVPAEPRSLGLENSDPTRSFSEFLLIAEKNLFSQDRSPSQSAEEASAASSEPPPKWAARPILHGVSSVRGERQAVMTVFEGNQRNRKFRTVKVGNDVQGFQVEEIGDSVVKLRWNDRQEVIDLADASEAQPAAAQKGKTAQATVTVITVGSAPRGRRAASGRAAGAATQPEAERGIEVAVVGGRVGGQRGQAQRGQRQQGQQDQLRPGTGAPIGQSPATGLGAGNRQPNRGGTRARPRR